MRGEKRPGGNCIWGFFTFVSLAITCAPNVACQETTSSYANASPTDPSGSLHAPQSSPQRPSAFFPLPSYLQTSAAQPDDTVMEWNKAIQYIVRANNVSNIAPRMFAFVHLAIWQALRANNDTAINPQPAPPVAVASYAAQSCLKTLVPLMFDKINALYRFQTGDFSEGELDLAKEIAEPVVIGLLSSRIGDGFQDVTPLAPADGAPGIFSDTGTANNMPNQAYADTTPLILPSNLSMWDFVANYSDTPEVPSPAYSIQYTPTYLYGDANSSLRSDDQTATAIFWADNGSPNHLVRTAGVQAQWNRVFSGTLPSSAPLDVTAELMAKLNVGLFDCIVSVYYLKFIFNRWRPITAIRNGDPDHTPDPKWTPLLATPNSPTYPSVSGCYAGLTSSLLTNYHGRDAFTFSVATENVGINGQILPNRVYTSFSQVAVEVSQSRYFGGLEFPIDSSYAVDFGTEIAEYLLEHWAELDAVY